MDSNIDSIQTPGPPEYPGGLAGLAAVVQELAAQDLHGLSDAALAAQVLEFRRLLDRLEGRWLQQLAAIDAHVAAGADAVLVEAARRLDPPRLRHVLDHLLLVADPDRAEARAERRHGRRGCGWPRPGKAWSPSTDSWRPRPATPCWRPWSPWPAPPTPTTPAAAGSAPPTPSPSWPAGPWRAAGCQRSAGSGPS